MIMTRAEHKSGVTMNPLSLRRTLPPAHITLLGDRQLGTLALRQGDPRLGTLTNDEDVGDPEYLISDADQC
jgi:hypothetical protein